MMKRYIRPLVQNGPAVAQNALKLAGGWSWFTHVEILSRHQEPQILPVDALSLDERERLVKPRASISGLSFDRPKLMGILNVTPDSFSDGGAHDKPQDAVQMAQDMLEQGADLIDIGGESTRPGADFVTVKDEISRTAPVIEVLRKANVKVPISIDTRKSEVAAKAIAAGADIVNDVSGFTFDSALVGTCVDANAPVCVMHAQGDPETMQDNPQYSDVLLDVYDFLENQIQMLEGAGVKRERIIADPGIGFGKTLAHNLCLLKRIGLFHSLGVPILLGASRKRFIGTISGEAQANKRAAGSVGVALGAIGQGIQIIRVHDVADHSQAVALWMHTVADNK